MTEGTAVFLDRDGVINELAFYPGSGEYEAPKTRKDFRMFPYAVGALKKLADAGHGLFLVTNQPDFAKGKTTMEELRAIHDVMHGTFLENGIRFTEYFYCYLHPDAVVPELLGDECRKPKPYFLNLARDTHGLDLASSWMVGDQDTDIETGKAAGARTILIEYERSARKRISGRPDFTAADLREAVDIILRENG